MDTKQLYELARNVENAKSNLSIEEARHSRALDDYQKAQQLLSVAQQALDDFLNGASGA